MPSLRPVELDVVGSAREPVRKHVLYRRGVLPPRAGVGLGIRLAVLLRPAHVDGANVLDVAAQYLLELLALGHSVLLRRAAREPERLDGPEEHEPPLRLDDPVALRDVVLHRGEDVVDVHLAELVQEAILI